MRRVRKAVIPAAGIGTRFLPITKVVPKEILPIGRKPVIQYVVEEAIASGIEEIIFIISPGKEMIVDYFRSDPVLESVLGERGKREEMSFLAVSRLAPRLAPSTRGNRWDWVMRFFVPKRRLGMRTFSSSCRMWLWMRRCRPVVS
ncbi:MAG: 2-C-methyl-D-erythritol 4-phosphate cytidylyltransferase [Deltaproteobacteria bacterium]|nr:2-C-methyl-D-erythritol 4-phosphate cytidylyltransferase [Deltaproteobacteria bacterium]